MLAYNSALALVLLAARAAAWAPGSATTATAQAARCGVRMRSAAPAKLAPVALNKKRLVLVRHGEVDLAQFNGV